MIVTIDKYDSDGRDQYHIVARWGLHPNSESMILDYESALRLRDLLLAEFPVNSCPVPHGAPFVNERRERIATAVLAGFAANQVCDPMAKPNVATAIVWADALIAALDKEA